MITRASHCHNTHAAAGGDEFLVTLKKEEEEGIDLSKLYFTV